MVCTVAIDRMKTAPAWNVPYAMESELIEGTEALIRREKPIAQWIGPYIHYMYEGVIMTLDTGDQYIALLINVAKKYYCLQPNTV